MDHAETGEHYWIRGHSPHGRSAEDCLDNPVALLPWRALWSLANRKVVQSRHPALNELTHLVVAEFLDNSMMEIHFPHRLDPERTAGNHH